MSYSNEDYVYVPELDQSIHRQILEDLGRFCPYCKQNPCDCPEKEEIYAD